MAITGSPEGSEDQGRVVRHGRDRWPIGCDFPVGRRRGDGALMVTKAGLTTSPLKIGTEVGEAHHLLLEAHHQALGDPSENSPHLHPPGLGTDNNIHQDDPRPWQEALRERGRLKGNRRAWFHPPSGFL